MTRLISTTILPNKQQFAQINAERALHLEAICVFAATGFFLDSDTYWKDTKCLSPSSDHYFNEQGILIKSEPNFQWHYAPRDLSFEQVLEEYIALLTTIMKEQLTDQPVILPLSGGLDSRSQAMVLKDFDNPVHAFSYSFPGGYPEHNIAERIARSCGFSFEAFKIPKGYLWNVIDDLAELNQCYSEFTHPRQMGVLPQLKQMNGLFSLGHWGDVLFDRGVPEGTTNDQLTEILLKKMLKPGGMELAEQLWEVWHLSGNFKDYLISRVESALDAIKIDNISAKARAFKTSQWAHRWTTTNLKVFEAAHPISLPYYDDRMMQFICSVPEAYLADRKLQIAHIKQDTSLAKITWQAQKPYNLNNFAYNKTPYNLPYRLGNKMKRVLQPLLGTPYIQRNFELQFLGAENDKKLKDYLFDTSFMDFIPQEVVKQIYSKFKSDAYVQYSHPTSMLLTLSLWDKHFSNR